MANILINGTFAPNGPFQIINNSDSAGAVQTFLNNTARDAWLTAHASNAVAGLYANVYNSGGATSVTYQLQNDLVTWTVVTALPAPGADGNVLTASGGVWTSAALSLTLAGDVTGALGSNTIAANAVTFAKFQQLGATTFVGNSTAGTANATALSVATAKTMLNLTGTNSGDVTLAGQNYLSIAGQVVTANAVDVSGANVTGTLAAARFGALTGDVTNTAGSYATTVSKIGGVSVAAGNNPLPQYFYLAGKSGGQVAVGGTGSSDVLTVAGSSSTSGGNTVQAIYRATTTANGAELRMSFTTAVLDGRDGAYMANEAGNANSSNFQIGTDGTLGIQFGTVTAGALGSNYVNIGHVVSNGLVVASAAAATWGNSNGVLSINGRDGLILGTAGLPGAAGGTAYQQIVLGTAGGPQLGFFGVTPVLRQSSTGVTLVSQLVTILQNYGLLT